MGQEHVGQQRVELPLFSLKDIHCLFCIGGLEYDIAVFTKHPGEKFTEFFFLRPLPLGDLLSRSSSLPSPVLFVLQQIDIRLASVSAEDPIVGAEVAQNASMYSILTISRFLIIVNVYRAPL